MTHAIGLDARAWPQRGDFYHTSNGHNYGPSLPDETLDAYKARVRLAYGSLRGIAFHQR